MAWEDKKMEGPMYELDREKILTIEDYKIVLNALHFRVHPSNKALLPYIKEIKE